MPDAAAYGGPFEVTGAPAPSDISDIAEELVQALAAAETARKKLEDVLNSIQEAFYSLSPAFRFTSVNQRAEIVWGKQREELLGCCIWDVFPHIVGTESFRMQNEAMRERRNLHFKTVSSLLHRWIECHIHPADDGGISVYFHDIHDDRLREQERERLLSERAQIVAKLEDVNKRQQDWLHQSEERFRLLVEGVRDYAIFMLDPFGNIATWNAGAERFKGYKEDEIIGQHFSRFYTEEDIANRHPQQELQIASRDGRYEEEGWRVRKDGTRFWANVVITALRDNTGHLRGFAKVTRDVTERRLREQERADAQAMAQQRRFLKDVLASVTQGRLWLCDSQNDLPSLFTAVAAEAPILLTPKSLKAVRTRAGAVAAQCDLPKERIEDLITAASECAMNAAVHAGGGTAKVYGDTASGSVQVWIEDAGKGIDLSHLPQATLQAGFSTGGDGIGHGFSLMIACCQRVCLLTGVNGTTVVLEQGRTAPEPVWLQETSL